MEFNFLNKKIFFLRHAKSSWDLNVSDINRPLNQRGVDDIIKIGKKKFGTPGVAHFLNFLSAVATVGSENFTQQSSNIPLTNPLSTPELSLNHLEQLQKRSKNQVWAPYFGGTFGPSGPPERGLTLPNGWPEDSEA